MSLKLIAMEARKERKKKKKERGGCSWKWGANLSGVEGVLVS